MQNSKFCNLLSATGIGISFVSTDDCRSANASGWILSCVEYIAQFCPKIWDTILRHFQAPSSSCKSFVERHTGSLRTIIWICEINDLWSKGLSLSLSLLSWLFTVPRSDLPQAKRLYNSHLLRLCFWSVCHVERPWSCTVKVCKSK